MARAAGYEDLDVVCPGCGLAAQDWPHLKTEGFLSPQGDFYCCRDCFEGRVCACGGHEREGKVLPTERFRGAKPEVEQ